MLGATGDLELTQTPGVDHQVVSDTKPKEVHCYKHWELSCSGLQGHSLFALNKVLVLRHRIPLRRCTGGKSHTKKPLSHYLLHPVLQFCCWLPQN